MANRRIEDFGILADAQDEDLFLISSGNITYALKYSTLAAAIFAAVEEAGFSIDPNYLGLEQDLETGYVYPTYKGVRSVNGLYMSAIGDLLYTISMVDCMGGPYIEVEEFNPLNMRFLYYSVDRNGQQEAVNGTGQIEVDGVVVHTFDVVPGENVLDIEPYLTVGTQKVVIAATNSENSLFSITYTVRQYCFIMVRMTEHTLTGDYVNDHVESIGNYAFYQYDGLTSVGFPVAQSIGDYSFYGCDALVSANIPVVKSIGDYTFYAVPKLNGLDAPALESIGAYAFYDCNGIPALSLPALKSVGNYAFYECSGLKSLDLPVLETIGDHSFAATDSGYLAIETVNLPSVKTIGPAAFRRCKYLTALDLPVVENIGNYAFYDNYALASVNLPVVKSIGNYAFRYDSVLASLNAPKLESVGSDAFANCSALTKLSLPALTATAYEAFAQCTSLETLVLPNAVETGQQGVFYGCSKLKTLDLPVAASLGKYTLGNCTALEALILRKTDTICTLTNTNAFQNSTIASKTGYIYVPSALLTTYQAATNWATYSTQFRAIEDYPEICGETAE